MPKYKLKANAHIESEAVQAMAALVSIVITEIRLLAQSLLPNFSV